MHSSQTQNNKAGTERLTKANGKANTLTSHTEYHAMSPLGSAHSSGTKLEKVHGTESSLREAL